MSTLASSHACLVRYYDGSKWAKDPFSGRSLRCAFRMRREIFLVAQEGLASEGGSVYDERIYEIDLAGMLLRAKSLKGREVEIEAKRCSLEGSICFARAGDER